MGREGVSVEFLRDEDRVDPARLPAVLLRIVNNPDGRIDEDDPRARVDLPRSRIDAVSLLSALRWDHAQSCRNTLICPV